MKTIVKQTLALAALLLMVPATPTLANSGLMKVTVAPDSPYRQTAYQAAKAESRTKFEIAPVKLEVAAKDHTVAEAPRSIVHPHWR
jgi:hypothetical protein